MFIDVYKRQTIGCKEIVCICKDNPFATGVGECYVCLLYTSNSPSSPSRMMSLGPHGQANDTAGTPHAIASAMTIPVSYTHLETIEYLVYLVIGNTASGIGYMKNNLFFL